ncbi:hypothetical protein I316_07196 [Kwoniella heveanensis BCC8398]|uniref:Protein-lysine N-methyltransferase EFM4 n=1 Tax=Kwoniella heveanensis BCC8398 TaxID=1296120 RepID=A0A1B9GJR7_9TREE|nr:hypothetical protein I316_07196 [Kwoniella heveanensis BCC8398]
MADEELPPSRLGTKDHWDSVYEREVRVYNDVGDEGEVWFGETSVTKMRKWAHKHIKPKADGSAVRIMEAGSGNGTLLLSFLTSPAPLQDVDSARAGGQRPPKYHLTGIDYCESAAVLARSIEQSRRETLPSEIENPESDSDDDYDHDSDDEEQGCGKGLIMNDVECSWRTADLLRSDLGGEKWDLVLDKGTYDALCLSDEGIEEEGGRLPSQVYPEKIAKLVEEAGFFLITSCNFTEEEIKARYTKVGLGEYPLPRL